MSEETPTVAYTQHARDKFGVLRRHGFEVSMAQVEATVLSPEQVEPDLGGRLIAQRRVDAFHVLRVVFKVEGPVRVVITFYPGRKERYETQL